MARTLTPPEKPLQPPSAKPWKGEGPGVFELVEDRRGATDVELIRQRLKTAREDYEVRYGKKA